jgi:sugar phosphate isomerase/epimerase
VHKGIAINIDGSHLNGQLATLESSLARAEAIGYDYAEISAYGVNAVINGRLHRSRVERVKAITRQFKLKYTVHGPCDLNLGLGDAPGIEEQALTAYLEFTSEVESSILVYHSGLIFLHEPAWGLTPLPDEATMQRRRQQEVEALQRLARRAQELGVTIAMENRDSHLWEVAALARHGLAIESLATYHPGLLIPEVNRQIAAVGHPNLGMTLDFGHAYIAARSCGFDFLEAVSQAAPHVRHIHMHDNFGKLDRFNDDQGEKLPLGQADLHLPPGWGEIPLREALQRLPDYRGIITLEIRPRYSDHLDEALQAARQLATSV